jgi:PadR family transcriptional regulator PadR
VWRELRKGSTGLLLLHFLAERPMYGFELADQLRVSTSGVLAFKEGTLYPALHRLEAEGLVESFWQASPAGPQRRYYRLTPAGRGALAERRREWITLTEAINGALGA